MGGFISTSLNKQESIHHALKNQDENTNPVIMHIEFCSGNGNNHFRLNTSKYSAMPQEKEVLIIDGARFRIEDVVEDYEVTDKKS